MKDLQKYLGVSSPKSLISVLDSFPCLPLALQPCCMGFGFQRIPSVAQLQMENCQELVGLQEPAGHVRLLKLCYVLP